MRQIMLSNPEMQRIIEQNPEVGHMLNDNSFLERVCPSLLHCYISTLIFSLAPFILSFIFVHFFVMTCVCQSCHLLLISCV
jgi:hypothetical protein